ncbi:BLUF domain-containing protein [Hymenobacter sp. BT635]|uniref:BLUF domain-containing protein n=1 Tax=Hymenobacter nitidus TaxID=2880929 RepID=A0ABS8AFH3_9BACT|nr:BLUF domain-containing protein [Hymenobacter nitidus]MCB2379151.1 BLUF domain-containing protein [Hymenobacter nitidus]
MPSSSLYHLVYQSAATTRFTDHDLEALLVQSRAWNQAHQLTGVLLYCDGDILQVLEGPEDEVEYIFRRIEQDPRHYDVTKLADGPITQRNFSQWSMGFKSVHPEDFEHLAGYLNPAQLVAEAKAPSLHELLASFVTDKKIRY